jgi:hypothetical protein
MTTLKSLFFNKNQRKVVQTNRSQIEKMLRAIALAFLAGLIFTASANAENPEKSTSLSDEDRAFVRQFAPQALPVDSNPTHEQAGGHWVDVDSSIVKVEASNKETQNYVNQIMGGSKKTKATNQPPPYSPETRAFIRQFAPQALPKETNPTQRIRQQALDDLSRVEPKEVQPSFTDVVGSIYDGVKETIEDFPAFNFFMLLLSVVITVVAVPLWRKLHK